MALDTAPPPDTAPAAPTPVAASGASPMVSLPLPPPPPEDARAALNRMRAIATGLFVLMAVTFVLAKVYQDFHPAIPFIRAFAEAAMVGALADWFAVTALFRHPLGIPIPHTAIVPRSKDRIGQGLGRFIARNFLQPDQVDRRLKEVDLAGGFARWVSEGERSKRLAQGLATALPRILGLLNDGKISAWLETAVAEKLSRTDVATLLSDGLDVLTREGRHRSVVDLIISHADIAVATNQDEFKARVSQRTDWLPKLFAVDAAASKALIDAIRDTLAAAATDTNHPLRSRVDDALLALARDLKEREELREAINGWVRKMGNHETMRRYVSSIWAELKGGLTEPGGEGQTRMVEALAGGLKDLAAALQRDPELRDTLNQRLKGWSVELAAARGAAVGDLVAETIRSWDARTVVDQIETAVGRDLQYIRINGTLIGGLIGLVIHTVSVAVFGG